MGRGTRFRLGSTVSAKASGCIELHVWGLTTSLEKWEYCFSITPKAQNNPDEFQLQRLPAPTLTIKLISLVKVSGCLAELTFSQTGAGRQHKLEDCSFTSGSYILSLVLQHTKHRLQGCRVWRMEGEVPRSTREPFSTRHNTPIKPLGPRLHQNPELSRTNRNHNLSFDPTAPPTRLQGA